MAERKNLANISVITDTETSMYHIGEVDGGFNEIELKKHIEKYGHSELCEKLTVMQWQIWNMVRKINSEKERNSSENVFSKI